jgi:hypothetical protein
VVGKDQIRTFASHEQPFTVILRLLPLQSGPDSADDFRIGVANAFQMISRVLDGVGQALDGALPFGIVGVRAFVVLCV